MERRWLIGKLKLSTPKKEEVLDWYFLFLFLRYNENDMNYRSFGKYKISEIGLGTWQLGGADWGAINEEEAFSILQQYVDAGGNFIDTADVYGMGMSEKVIGRFLKTLNTPVYVATKLGRRNDAPNGWNQNFTYEFMRKQAEDSLLHLGVDRLFFGAAPLHTNNRIAKR